MRAWFRRLLPYAVVAVLFVVSREIFWHRGIRYDATSLTWFWQYLDVGALRHHLLESLFYDHAQPPLFNAYLGVVLKLAGTGSPRSWFSASYFAMGLGLHLAMCALMMRLRVPALVAVLVTGVFAFAPASILYESWLFYTYPVALMLVLAALVLHRYVASRRVVDAAGFFTLLLVAVLTRSLFHWVWMATWVAFVPWVLRERRRAALTAAVVPMILATALFAKNWVVFGSPSSSTWLGMSLAKLTTQQLPLPDKRAMVQEGSLSDLAFILPFSPIVRYPTKWQSRVVGPDVPALTLKMRASGISNYNHSAYIAISHQYLADARAVLWHHPGVYFRSERKAWLLFLMSPSEYWFLDGNRKAIHELDRFYNSVFYLIPDEYTHVWHKPDRTSLTYLEWRAGYGFGLFLLLSLVWALWRAVPIVRRRSADPEARARQLALLFIATTILWVAVIGNMFELGENNRFRAMVEPLCWVLIAAAATALVRWVRRRLRRGQ